MSEQPKINSDADILDRLESEPLTIHLAGDAAEEIRRLRAAVREFLDADEKFAKDAKFGPLWFLARDGLRKALEGK